MSNLKQIIFLITGFIFLFLHQCSSTDVIVNGSSSETVIGRVFNTDGTPACSTIVTLLPDKYNPVTDDQSGTPVSDTTDAEGIYCLKLQDDSSSWSITATRMTMGTSALITDLHRTDDTTVAADAILKNPGSVTVMIASDSGSGNGYLYIPGTRLYTLFKDGATSVTIDSVPAGIIPEVTLFLGDKSPQIIREYNVVVEPQKTTEIHYPQWTYSKRIYLNTAAEGASVSGNVYNFPVLIRLTQENFDFMQAERDGSDIRFSGNQNGFLPCEIERWDAVAGKADLWVKIDTVYGNDSTQSIIMFWGNTSAPVSTSSSVFDTAAGFEGVWHLNDHDNGLVRDATVNGYHGIFPDSSDPSIADGVIGECHLFDGRKDCITMPNTADSKLTFNDNDSYTVSAWVYLDAPDNAARCIVTKGFGQYYLRFSYFPLDTPVWEFVNVKKTEIWQGNSVPADTQGQWTFLTGVRQGQRQLLYCNGILVDSTLNEWSIDGTNTIPEDLSIGKFIEGAAFEVHGGNCFFKGAIDEVRILRKASDADWVRLCYMNQRIDNKLVEFMR